MVQVFRFDKNRTQNEKIVMKIPKISLGTWQLRGSAGVDVVTEAIYLGDGYLH